AKWHSWLADSKALTKPLNAITLQPVNIRPVSKSAEFSQRSSQTKTIRRFICEPPGRLRWRLGTKNLNATASIITRTVSVRRLENGNKHQRRRSCLPTINFTPLELLKVKRRRSSSSVALS